MRKSTSIRNRSGNRRKAPIALCSKGSNGVSHASRVTLAEIKRQAHLLARESRLAEPAATKRIFWFPHRKEVRLVVADESVSATPDGQVHPFYFRPSPRDALPAWSATALVRPEEIGRLDLPPAWGNWKDAVEIQ